MWKLLRTLYGTKQAARAFWKVLLKSMKKTDYEQSRADPCLYYRWSKRGLSIWTSWVDNLFGTGNEPDVQEARKKILNQFKCDDISEATEYVGCKIK